MSDRFKYYKQAKQIWLCGFFFFFYKGLSFFHISKFKQQKVMCESKNISKNFFRMYLPQFPFIF